MKYNLAKILTSSFILLFALNSQVLAQDEDIDGYRCEDNQCISCDPSEDNCNEGVCSAFRCEESSDKEAPFAPIITNTFQLDKVNNPDNLRLTGLAEENSILKVYIDDDEVSENQVGGDEFFDISIDTNIEQSGSYEVFLISEDSAGNESDPSDTIEVQFDADDPEIELSNIPDFTNFETLLLNGNTEAGSDIFVINNSNTIYETGADKNGNFDIRIPISDESNTFTIRAEDSVGNIFEETITIQKDDNISRSLRLVDTNNSTLEFDIPEGIIAIEVYKNGELIQTDQPENNTYFYELDSSTRVSDRYEFIGIDASGNQTEGVNYRQTNTIGIVIFIVIIISVFLIIGYLSYLIYIGRIKIPGLKELLSGQSKMNLDQEKDSKKEENIKPKTIKKEY